MNVLPALQALIRDDPAYLGRFGNFDFGDGVSRPCVFTRAPAPSEAPNPVATLAIAGTTPNETRDQAGSDFLVTIQIIGDKTHDDSRLRDLAFAVWKTVNRATLSGGSEWEYLQTSADAPQFFSDRDEFPGYIINTRTTGFRLS